jgi:hypothetical protein
MNFMRREQVEALKRAYPVGTRLKAKIYTLNRLFCASQKMLEMLAFVLVNDNIRVYN